MKLFVPKELESDETRVALLPVDVGKLVVLGAQIEVETGAGQRLSISDSEYERAGVKISNQRRQSLSSAEMVLRLGIPNSDEIELLSPGVIHISYMDPFHNHDGVRQFAAGGISSLSLEMIPRTTLAQKMDVLSSQASLAGYAAVVLAASRQKCIFPMMITPAGTISPARVFVIGAGVAGLQAIATAKRLGARVDAFDVRPEAQEQILSLGAKALKIDLGQTGQTKGGYAKKLTDEQLAKQREALAKQCALSDVVITTAKVFGRRSPLIITNEMLDAMKAGSIVVDLAVETGGNVEASELGKEIDRHGVTIIGYPELQRRVPAAASQMFSSNLYNLIEHFWNKEAGRFELNHQDEILQGCLITHEGQIVNETIRNAIGEGA